MVFLYYITQKKEGRPKPPLFRRKHHTLGSLELNLSAFAAAEEA
jgi:hypothetical protein